MKRKAKIWRSGVNRAAGAASDAAGSLRFRSLPPVAGPPVSASANRIWPRRASAASPTASRTASPGEQTAKEKFTRKLYPVEQILPGEQKAKLLKTKGKPVWQASCTRIGEMAAFRNPNRYDGKPIVHNGTVACWIVVDSEGRENMFPCEDMAVQFAGLIGVTEYGYVDVPCGLKVKTATARG